MSSLTVEQKQDQLTQSLSNIMTKAREDFARLGKTIMIKAYWDMGQQLDQSKIETGDLPQIARNLNMDYTQLNRCLMFYRQWPKVCPESAKEAQQTNALSWGHYRLLITEKNKTRRNNMLKQAREHKWNRKQLQAYLKNSDDLNETATQTKGALTPIDRPTETTYLYRAIVDDVVDGDTLLVRIDLGFDVWRTQRIRLAEIDCPERKTQEGQAAKEFVQNALSEVEWIMIRTNRIDLYGRYVGYVFYDKTQTDKYTVYAKGNHLNQQLIDAGHAVRM